MKIEVKSDYYGTDVIFEAENVKVTESISETVYALKEDGKKDFNKRLGKEITDTAIKMFVNLLDDIVYYRNENFDSSNLIENLFDKLPEEKQKELIKKLNDNYEFEVVA